MTNLMFWYVMILDNSSNCVSKATKNMHCNPFCQHLKTLCSPWATNNLLLQIVFLYCTWFVSYIKTYDCWGLLLFWFLFVVFTLNFSHIIVWVNSDLHQNSSSMPRVEVTVCVIFVTLLLRWCICVHRLHFVTNIGSTFLYLSFFAVVFC